VREVEFGLTHLAARVQQFAESFALQQEDALQTVALPVVELGDFVLELRHDLIGMLPYLVKSVTRNNSKDTYSHEVVVVALLAHFLSLRFNLLELRANVLAVFDEFFFEHGHGLLIWRQTVLDRRHKLNFNAIRLSRLY
jgi:hypothetical protein